MSVEKSAVREAEPILLRSYAEHRAAGDGPERNAFVEAGPLMSLLYLNNNLHGLHHERPQVAWYALPPQFRAERERLLDQSGNFHFDSYWSVIRRCAFSPGTGPVHPANYFTHTDPGP